MPAPSPVVHRRTLQTIALLVAHKAEARKPHTQRSRVTDEAGTEVGRLPNGGTLVILPVIALAQVGTRHVGVRRAPRTS